MLQDNPAAHIFTDCKLPTLLKPADVVAQVILLFASSRSVLAGGAGSEHKDEGILLLCMSSDADAFEQSNRFSNSPLG